jgi:hypothetical protein
MSSLIEAEKYSCLPRYGQNRDQAIAQWMQQQFENILDRKPISVTVAAVALAVFAKKTIQLKRMYPLKKLSPRFNIARYLLYSFALKLLFSNVKRWKHLLSPDRIDMTQKLYQERSCIYEDRCIADVKYLTQGDKKIPVLTTYTDNPTERGYAHGLLLGKEALYILNHVIRPMFFLLRVVGQDFYGSRLSDATKGINLTAEHLEEMRGVVAGIREYIRRENLNLYVTLDDVIRGHAFVDAYKRVGVSFGCSSVAFKRGEEHCSASNFDFPGMGSMGKYMLLLRHQGVDLTSGREWKIESLAFPGYVGVIRGDNGKLRAFVNEVGNTSRSRGIPYVLFTSKVLRRAQSVAEVTSLITEWSHHPDLLPASSFILTVADNKGDAKAFQFFVTKDEPYIERTYDENGMLVVTNHGISRKGLKIARTEANSSTKEREDKIYKVALNLLQHRAPLEHIGKAALKASNLPATLCCVIHHNGKTERVFSNNHAARLL